MDQIMEKFSDYPMIVRTKGADGLIRINGAFHEKVGYNDDELAEKSLLHWIDPCDHEKINTILDRGDGSCLANHKMRDGNFLPLSIQISNFGQDYFMLGRSAHFDYHEFNKEDINKEEIINESTVSETLHTIANIVEAQLPDYKCSILLVENGHFVKGAGPSLPDSYNNAIDGYAIGPMVGSCGTAIYWNMPVIVEDIQADPLWANLAVLAKEAGVAACWSHPFTNSDGKVLGALAFYSPVPQSPTEEELNLLHATARMTGLAVERGRAKEAL